MKAKREHPVSLSGRALEALDAARTLGNGKHEFYLMCDDVEAFREEMRRRDVDTTDVKDEGWGLLTRVTLPGGGRLGVYEPRHARPPVAS